MRISPIRTYNNSYCNKTNNQTRISAQKPSFKSKYGDVFKKVYTKKFVHQAEAERAYTELNDAIFSAKNIYIPVKYFCSPLRIAIKEAPSNIYKYNGEILASSSPNGITFYEENGEEQSIRFETDSSGHLQITQDHAYGFDEYTFWTTTGNLIKYKHSSGTGMAQVTKTTHYDDKGDELSLGDRLKNFFGF